MSLIPLWKRLQYTLQYVLKYCNISQYKNTPDLQPYYIRDFCHDICCKQIKILKTEMLGLQQTREDEHEEEDQWCEWEEVVPRHFPQIHRRHLSTGIRLPIQRPVHGHKVRQGKLLHQECQVCRQLYGSQPRQRDVPGTSAGRGIHPGPQ